MRTPVDYVRGVRHPEAFHGRGVHRGYFEGWYIKLVSADRSQRWAVIPGVFRGLAGDDGARDEAFVQVLDGLTGRSWYHRFDPADFEAASDRFAVRVGGNTFSPDGVTLDLPQLRGGIRYTTATRPLAGLRTLRGTGDHGLVRARAVHGVLPRHRLLRPRAGRRALR